MAFAFYLPDVVKKNPLNKSPSVPLMPDDLSRIRRGSVEPVEAIVQYVPNVRNTGLLDINEKVEDIFVIENGTAVFECKVGQDLEPTCAWYKDGHILNPNDVRISMTRNNSLYRLEIKHVTFNDQGIYTIECWHKYQYIVVKGHLYVLPQKINDGAFYQKIKHAGTGVIRHLFNVKIYKTDTVNLKATFGFMSNEYFWYKNNEVVRRDRRTSMKKRQFTASLQILNAQPTDAGVYYVVALTEQGYLSSCADVQVGDYNEIRPVLPILEEFLPERTVGFVGEELRMVVKVNLDYNTMIQWQKNGDAIENPDYITINYGNQYVGLTLPRMHMTSAGIYGVGFMNKVVCRVVASNTCVKVKQAERAPDVQLIRPLSSAVACCGAKVSFDCRFDVKDPLYFYAIWYVGPYKVEHTNSLFKVTSNGGQYLLYIKNVERAMAGDVICELRQAWPNQKSVMLQRTYAHLVVVPLAIVQEARTRPVDDTKLHFQQNAGNDEITVEDVDGDNTVVAHEQADYVLKVVYCRLDDNDGLFFVHAVRGDQSTKPMTLKITEHNRADQTSMMMQWADSNALNFWYIIEMAQCNGAFVELGLTSRPAFTIEYPSLYRLLVFRIRAVAVNPTSGIFDMQVFVALPLDVTPRQPPLLEKQTIDSFNSRYSETGHTLGAGAFGVVSLIRNKVTGAYYAAKFVKRSDVNNKEHSMSEFHIMRKLHHPKIVNLFGFYESEVAHILVMEFCWGGELFDRLIGEEFLKEADVVGYIKQICEALEYLHKESIVHLDLKPENIMCISPESLQVKLIDFGLARKVNGIACNAVYGTRDYVAPEVFEYQPITTATDMWTLGVVTYLLLSGVMPFAGKKWVQRAYNIAQACYNYNDKSFSEVSDVAKDFVDHLIVRIPGRRMSAAQALKHKWILEGPVGKKPKCMTLMRVNLKSYLADYRSRWQRAGNLMMATERYRATAHEYASSGSETPESLSEAGASGSGRDAQNRMVSPELPFDDNFDDLSQ